MTDDMYIGPYKGFTPYMILKNTYPNNIAYIRLGIGTITTGYSNIIIQSMTALSIRNSMISNGYRRFAMGNGFVMDESNKNILVLGVGIYKSMPRVIFVSDQLDTARAIRPYRSIRRYWRKAMAINKECGVRMESVSQEFMNQFIIRFNFQPDSKKFAVILKSWKEEAILNIKVSL